MTMDPDDSPDVPPRKNPPDSWPMEKRLTSFLNWVEDQPEEIDLEDEELPEFLLEVLNHPQMEGSAEEKPLRYLFDPPLVPVDVEELGPEEIEETLRHYEDSFADRDIRIDTCEHLDSREKLRWMVELLNETVMDHPTIGVTFSYPEECPDCRYEQVRRELDSIEDSERLRRLKADLMRVRSSFDGFRADLEEADREVMLNPEDPRSEMNHLPVLRRMMGLFPVVLDRAEEDLNRLDEENRMSSEDLARFVVGFDVLSGLWSGVLHWYEADGSRKELDQFRDALGKARGIGGKPPDARPGRLYRDIARLEPDLEILVGLAEERREARRVQPDRPDPAEEDADAWRDFYREKMHREEPALEFLYRHKLNQENLKKAFVYQEAEHRYNDWRADRFQQTYRLMKARRTVHDSVGPREFLEFPVIRELPESWEENEPEETTPGEVPGEPPPDSGLDYSVVHADDELAAEDDFREDPVWQTLMPFVSRMTDVMEESEGERSNLEHYLTLLARKPMARIASARCYPQQAALDGVYLYTIDCLERIREAIGTFDAKPLAPFSERADEIIMEIRERLN